MAGPLFLRQTDGRRRVPVSGVSSRLLGRLFGAPRLGR